MALAACASPSAADGPGGAGSADRAQPAARAARAAQVAALAAESDDAAKALLHPLIPRAPRDFTLTSAGGIHTVRVRQERWSGGLRTQTMAAVLDWGGGGRVELELDNTGGPVLDGGSEDEPQDMRIRILGDTVYGVVGDKPAEGAGGRHWVRLEGAGATSFRSVSAASLNPLKSVTGILMLPTTEPHGSGTFHGVKARHYRSTINEASLDRAAQGAFGAVSAEQLRQALESAGLTSETIDLWMSEDRLPLEVTVVDDGPYRSAKSVVDYLDYGLAVDVHAPPAFDTVGSEELDAAGG
jgi:hypothetical protein